MEFYPGLTTVDPAIADEIAIVARRANLPVFIISTAKGIGRDALFDSVRATLPLDPPLESSRSWDALSDSLWEGLRLLRSDTLVIIWPDASTYRRTSPAEYATALSILNDVVESIADDEMTGGRPKRVSVFVGGDSRKGHEAMPLT
jgi:hypothetical protein